MERIDIINESKNIVRCDFQEFEWDEKIETVINVWMTTNPKEIKDLTPKEIKKVTTSYVKGYLNRPSIRTSNPPGTRPDKVIDCIIKGRLPSLSANLIEQIKWGHRLSMSAENILGLILEEYLSTKLSKSGWFCCWGSSIKAVDFCSSNSKLLQVKNRSNTENSSSSAIRKGTTIEKWYRVHARTGQTNWDSLQLKTGSKEVNEKDFLKYTRNLVEENPGSVFVEGECLFNQLANSNC